jgi:KaiC/GvpD/RAD55 family RecA-like ATPase
MEYGTRDRGSIVSTVVRLPPEVREFLDLPGPQTLLVRGPPGSGKTTFGLALLEAFKGDKLLLVTSRVSHEELVREFPWLGRDGGRSIQILDTALTTETVRETAHALAAARENLLGGDGQDARDAQSFLWLPSVLQDAWSRLDPDRRALVVIDSWDALVEQYLGASNGHGGEPDRGEIERMLLRRVAQTPAHVVFILEREEQTALDYLVNGVLVARRETGEERLQRWLTVSKLRGIRIENPIYPYTLEGGKFESILPARPYLMMRPGRPEPEPDSMPGHIWPGSSAFAQSFGRFAFGQITLFELDDAVPTPATDMITETAVAQVLLAGGRAVVVPHSSEAPNDFVAQLAEVVPRDRLGTGLRLLQARRPALAAPDTGRYVIAVDRLEFTSADAAPLSSPAIRFLREGITPEAPGMYVASAQGLEAVAMAIGAPVSPEAALRLPGVLLAGFRDAPVHGIVICRRTSPLLAPMRASAAARLELTVRQGRIFIHGISPWTPNYVLTDGTERTPYTLLRVV